MRNNSILNIVIIYEDLKMGQHANRVCQSVAQELGVRQEFNQELWNFRILAVAEIQAHAIHAATRADLVVVAAHGHEELPAEVLSWIEAWLDKRQSRPGALVALFDECHPQAGARVAIRRHLQSAAQRARLDFLTPASPAAQAQCPGSSRATECAA